MNILFLTLGQFESIEAHSLYTDLLRQFRNAGHTVYAVSTHERRTGLPNELKKENGAWLLRLKTGNITKCGLIEKGISTLFIEKIFLSGIKRYFSGVRFDLILYSTPPITFCSVIKSIKQRDNAKTYLLLKDIFPQNAVDIGLLSKKSLIHRYFRKKEKLLYAVSDGIGCMSEANILYLLKNNPNLHKSKVGLCPNCIEPQNINLTVLQRRETRAKYGLPQDKVIFIYGGNLGKPQGIPFVVECLRAAQNTNEAFFLIVGDGAEYKTLSSFLSSEGPKNAKLIKRLPAGEFDILASASDVGLIFLDYRFTIPNFPSRLLSYMQAKLPVLAATDFNTDVGKIAEENGFGFECKSNDTNAFLRLVNKFLLLTKKQREAMGQKAFACLTERYSASKVYNRVFSHRTGLEYKPTAAAQGTII